MRPSRVSETEFLDRPESLERVELIDGEVILSPCPVFWHQEVLRRLVLAFGRWAEGKRDVTVAQAPLDVRFAPNRIVTERLRSPLLPELELDLVKLFGDLS